MHMKILIDNGHGIDTLGKRSPEGGELREYLWSRQTANILIDMLRQRGLDAELLVPEDTDISLGKRCARANAFCDRFGVANVLLVSLHLNAAGMGYKWRQGRGWEAWTSPGPTRSDLLAECLYDAAKKHLPTGTPLRTDLADGDRDKESRFQILTGTRCPAVLTENLFMDNREEAAWLLTTEGMHTIALLHADGITQFLKS